MLGCTWERLGRFEINIKNNDVFGCRVSEANKDGTLHGHIIIFYDRSKEEQLFSKSGIFFKHFAQESEHQLEVVIGDVDSAKSKESGVASASSYCFKYITKAVGADVLDSDNEKHASQANESQQNMLDKIDAWRAAIGVRSHDFFGIKGYGNLWDSSRKVGQRLGFTTKVKDKNQKTKTIYQEPFPSIITNHQLEHEYSSLPEKLTDNELTEKLDYVLLTKRNIHHYDYTMNNYKPGDVLEIDEAVLDELELHFHQSEKTIAYSKEQDDFHNKSTQWFRVPLEDELHWQNELDYHIKLNGALNSFQMCDKEYQFKKVVEHSINGDFAKFHKACKKYNIELIREDVINKYGETVQKIIGVNTGTWVCLFKKYVIIDTQLDSKKFKKYKSDLELKKAERKKALANKSKPPEEKNRAIQNNYSTDIDFFKELTK